MSHCCERSAKTGITVIMCHRHKVSRALFVGRTREWCARHPPANIILQMAAFAFAFASPLPFARTFAFAAACCLALTPRQDRCTERTSVSLHAGLSFGGDADTPAFRMSTIWVFESLVPLGSTASNIAKSQSRSAGSNRRWTRVFGERIGLRRMRSPAGGVAGGAASRNARRRLGALRRGDGPSPLPLASRIARKSVSVAPATCSMRRGRYCSPLGLTSKSSSAESSTATCFGARRRPARFRLSGSWPVMRWGPSCGHSTGSPGTEMLNCGLWVWQLDTHSCGARVGCGYMHSLTRAGRHSSAYGLSSSRAVRLRPRLLSRKGNQKQHRRKIDRAHGTAQGAPAMSGGELWVGRVCYGKGAGCEVPPPHARAPMTSLYRISAKRASPSHVLTQYTRSAMLLECPSTADRRSAISSRASAYTCCTDNMRRPGLRSTAYAMCATAIHHYPLAHNKGCTHDNGGAQPCGGVSHGRASA